MKNKRTEWTRKKENGQIEKKKTFICEMKAGKIEREPVIWDWSNFHLNMCYELTIRKINHDVFLPQSHCVLFEEKFAWIRMLK